MIFTDDFKNKVVLVTGAAGGLGKETAIRFAGASAKVVVADLKVEIGEATTRGIVNQGGTATFIKLDVTDDQSVETMVQQVLNAWGTVDVLVNSAGTTGKGFIGFDKIPMTEWDFTYDVNVKGIIRCCKAVTPVFKKKCQGKIVNVSSVTGRMPAPGLIQYGASKAAVINLSKTLAVEMARYNVNVNTVCPGWIWTPIYDENPDIKSLAEKMGKTPREFFMEMVEKNCPLKREQTKADIANAILFLSSDAAQNITGQAINVDGGAYMS